MEISHFQKLMYDLYIKSDLKRGIHRTGLWLTEEMGELMRNIKKDPSTLNSAEMENIGEEMADIYAWVASLANILKIDLEEAVWKKYPNKCPKCGQKPCQCEINL